MDRSSGLFFVFFSKSFSPKKVLPGRGSRGVTPCLPTPYPTLPFPTLSFGDKKVKSFGNFFWHINVDQYLGKKHASQFAAALDFSLN